MIQNMRHYSQCQAALTRTYIESLMSPAFMYKLFLHFKFYGGVADLGHDMNEFGRI